MNMNNSPYPQSNPFPSITLHVKQQIYANLTMSLTVSQKTGRRICSWSLNRSPWFTWNIVDNSSSRRSSSSLSLSLSNLKKTLHGSKLQIWPRTLLIFFVTFILDPLWLTLRNGNRHAHYHSKHLHITCHCSIRHSEALYFWWLLGTVLLCGP